MSSSPEHLRSGRTRILRDVTSVAVAAIEIDQIEALPYTMDGKPITSELRAAKDAGFRKGWDKGWADGRAAGEIVGRDAAYQEFTEILGPTIEAMNRALTRVNQADGLVLDRLAEQLVGFAYQVAEAVLGHAIGDPDGAVEAALTRALRLVPDRGDVVVKLNPDDVSIVEALDHLLPGREVRLAADPIIERGGVVVQVGSCRIDAQLGPALERVRRELGLER